MGGVVVAHTHYILFYFMCFEIDGTRVFQQCTLGTFLLFPPPPHQKIRKTQVEIVPEKMKKSSIDITCSFKI